jgi:hypothetical protein
VGVEIRESPVTDEEFEAMERFVHDYLAASVEAEDAGGRMRWYPWHSEEYRFNHIANVVDLAGGCHLVYTRDDVFGLFRSSGISGYRLRAIVRRFR